MAWQYVKVKSRKTDKLIRRRVFMPERVRIVAENTSKGIRLERWLVNIDSNGKEEYWAIEYDFIKHKTVRAYRWNVGRVKLFRDDFNKE